MSVTTGGNIRKFIRGAVAILPLVGMPSNAAAEDLTAASMTSRMNDKEQYHYIAGIIAGLSTARFVKDGDDKGSSCIQSWFYDTPDMRTKIYAAFEKFGDKSPSAILYAMAAKECGK